MKEELLLTLNKQLANWNVLYVKLHNFHWNVSGNQFFTLHAKFEELFNEADIHIDTIAERVLSLRGLPVATMKSYLELTSLVEAHGSESSSEMVESTIRDCESILSELKLGMSLAEQQGDTTTGDMFQAINASLEKHLWMLTAYLD